VTITTPPSRSTEMNSGMRKTGIRSREFPSRENP
jgi:hypothetical protein